MLFVGVFLLALWITGLATANTLGGFIHVLLVLAFMALLSRTLKGSQIPQARGVASFGGAARHRGKREEVNPVPCPLWPQPRDSSN